MMKTDSPVRAHSEMSNEGYKAFTKDKRTRTTRSNNDAIFSSTRREGGEGEHFEKRRSYNPNFTRDNQLTERNRRQGEFRSERNFDNREGGFRRERNFSEERGERSFNREHNFNREERGERSFNREGGFRRERNFSEERSERSFNREHNFNREERGERSFNREGGFKRERNFGEERGERSFNRERNFNREERGERSYNREGGFRRERNFSEEHGERNFNRERTFNREERGERSFNREGGFRRERNFGEERGERNFNRERTFNREERGERSFNREGGFKRERNFSEERGERSFNREGGKTRFSKGGFGKPSFRNGDRKPHSERRSEPKTYVNTANHYTLENYPTYDTPKQEGEIRLNRYISMSGICSRREADDFIASGAITVNGVVVTELGTKVMPNDVVCYNGEKIENEKKVYIVMNKPKGFVTTLDDPHADKSVMDLVRNACTERIYPVGRLDKNSVGVLLLTNDGDLAKKLTHPTYEKKKIYQVSLDKHLTRADMEQLILGITLEDGDIAADDVCYVEDPKMKNAVGIEIHSGRNRIVRRMFEHLGYHVGKLDRVYFAGLTKQKLKRGEWRFLTEKEVAMLKSGSYE